MFLRIIQPRPVDKLGRHHSTPVSKYPNTPVLISFNERWFPHRLYSAMFHHQHLLFVSVGSNTDPITVCCVGGNSSLSLLHLLMLKDTFTISQVSKPFNQTLTHPLTPCGDPVLGFCKEVLLAKGGVSSHHHHQQQQQRHQEEHEGRHVQAFQSHQGTFAILATSRSHWCHCHVLY